MLLISMEDELVTIYSWLCWTFVDYWRSVGSSTSRGPRWHSLVSDAAYSSRSVVRMPLCDRVRWPMVTWWLVRTWWLVNLRYTWNIMEYTWSYHQAGYNWYAYNQLDMIFGYIWIYFGSVWKMECLRGLLFEYWIIGKVMITWFLQTQVTDSQDG